LPLDLASVLATKRLRKNGQVVGLKWLIPWLIRGLKIHLQPA